MKILLHVTDALGRVLSVETELSEIDTTMRALSVIGATSGNLLGGNLTLPLENEPDFDWSLIGGRGWTSPDGEVGVMWRGSFYKRREYAAKTTGVKMPAAVKFSRGARPTDPEDIKEGDEAGIQYVTLCTFKGGKRQEQWAKKGPGKQEAAPPADQVRSTVESASDSDSGLGAEQLAKLTEWLDAKLPGTAFSQFPYPAFAAQALGREIGKLSELTPDDARTVCRAAKDAKDAA